MSRRTTTPIGYHPERLAIRPADVKPKQTKSSAIGNVDYDPEREQLMIEFVERGTFVYYDFPIHAWVEFNGAGSRGTYFNLYIRDHGYQYERVS